MHVPQKDVYVVSVKEHKTGSLGPAKLILDPTMMAKIGRTSSMFVLTLPNLGMIFQTSTGSLPIHFNNLLQFMEKFWDISIPTATMVGPRLQYRTLTSPPTPWCQRKCPTTSQLGQTIIMASSLFMLPLPTGQWRVCKLVNFTLILVQIMHYYSRC